MAKTITFFGFGFYLYESFFLSALIEFQHLKDRALKANYWHRKKSENFKLATKNKSLTSCLLTRS